MKSQSNYINICSYEEEEEEENEYHLHQCTEYEKEALQTTNISGLFSMKF